MHVEITIRAKDDLPEGLVGKLREGFESGMGPEEVFARTTMRGPYEAWAPMIAHAQLAHRRALVFFRMDAGTLMTYLEQVDERDVERADADEPGRAHVGDLRRVMDDVVPRLEKLLGDGGARVDSLKFEMIAEQDKTVQEGTKQGWWARFHRLLRGDAFEKLYVPLATFVATLLYAFFTQDAARGAAQQASQGLTQSVGQAAFNAAVAFLALLLYLLIKATLFEEEYHVNTVEQ